MRNAALYDIHANLVALEAVLAEVDRLGCEQIVIGGDAVLGPEPRATLERLLERRDMVLVRGNTDRELMDDTAPPPGNPWGARRQRASRQLRPEQRAFLAGLPTTVSRDIPGLGATLFCHGTPRSDEEIITRITPESRLREVLAAVAEDTVVCGHTHVQFDRRMGKKRIVNAGSVGMAFEGRAAAFWALLGPEVTLQETTYDVERAAARIRASGYPDVEDYIRMVLLEPESAAEATDSFERMAEQRRPTAGEVRGGYPAAAGNP